MSELGLDEQKSDMRPVSVGNAAMDADARISHATDTGKSGEAQGDHARLNLGGLSICPAIGLLGGQLPEMGWEKSAEAIVVGVHRLWQASLAIELTHQQRAESFDARSSFVIS
jgi:hypothetical protein